MGASVRPFAFSGLFALSKLLLGALELETRLGPRLIDDGLDLVLPDDPLMLEGALSIGNGLDVLGTNRSEAGFQLARQTLDFVQGLIARDGYRR